MASKRLYVYAVTAAMLIVLLVASALNYSALQSANAELEHYKRQQREMARVIVAEHLPDMQAARSGWIASHQAEYGGLQSQGITVEADYLGTAYFTAVLDPKDPYYASIGPAAAPVPGQITVGLGQYYLDNMTRASDWSAQYTVNSSTHEVSGLTASLVQGLAYEHYVQHLSPGIYTDLGVSQDAIRGASPLTLDTSYIPETDTWLDVTEYKYSLRNTDLPVYLKIKTYVNGSTEAVGGVEVSRPYYTTASTIAH